VNRQLTHATAPQCPYFTRRPYFEYAVLEKPFTSPWLSATEYIRLSWKEIERRSPLHDFFAFRGVILDHNSLGLKVETLSSTSNATCLAAGSTSTTCTSCAESIVVLPSGPVFHTRDVVDVVIIC
jgi:hypothetical protein